MKRSDTEVREQENWLLYMLPFLSLSFEMCFCGGLFAAGHLDGCGISRFQSVPHLQAQPRRTLCFGGRCGTATAQVLLPLSTFTALLSAHLP